MTMKSKSDLLIKVVSAMAVFSYLIILIINRPVYIIDYICLIPKAISVIPVLFIIFEKWIWRYLPFIKIPKLNKEYSGQLKYNYNNLYESKEIKVIIKQTFLSIRIKFITNEIESNSLVAEIVQEDDDFILYYCYRTNPSSEFSEKNPIQIGTCRLNVSNPKSISGIYWTNRKTMGDILLS